MRRPWKITITLVAVLVAALMVSSIIRPRISKSSLPINEVAGDREFPNTINITKLQTLDESPLNHLPYDDPRAAAIAGPVPDNLAKNGKPRSSDSKLMELALHKLRKGILVDSTPERMKTGQTARVMASIGSVKVSLDALEQDMPSGENQKVVVEKTPISPKMKMTLKSGDFDITHIHARTRPHAGHRACEPSLPG
jgi:hypothetical protein